MCFDICLFIHFSTRTVLVEKSFRSIFNISESTRKPAVLIFLEINSLRSVCGEGGVTAHPTPPLCRPQTRHGRAGRWVRRLW